MSASIRVLIVDDSAFIRYTVAKHLEADPDIEIVGNARDGVEALDQIKALKPHVVVLDVEMPRMDGLTALKRIMAECPTPVVMLSALTQRGAQTTIRALMRGAFDFVPKPDAKIDVYTVIAELIEKIKAATGARPAKLPSAGTAPIVTPTKRGPRPLQKGDALIVIGASTGGPRALQKILADLPGNLPASVLIVQHMPPGFTRSLAQRLNENSSLIVQEAADGDRLARGLALLAPGDFHLRFRGLRQVSLDQGPRCQHVRPAVDVTMESAVEYHGANVIGVVLTGMGQDGTAGAGRIKAAGGRIIAEHESTSVVYGMPASVVRAGWADLVVPLPNIASTLVKLVNHGRRGI
ncbi:MAG: chemotaxis response regulator protein-glutamate methylesterase [Anaerolineae bacterium]|nr:chemotaxis response regulator protein-glutamate methylesterase [Anaerolineae bacterium]